MKIYHDLLRHILDHGEDRGDRTGVGTRSLFGYQMRFDLQEGFPLLTTKKMAWKAIVRELLWFIAGDTNIKALVDQDVKIWNEWPFTDYLEANGLHEQFPRYSEVWQAELERFIARIKADPEFAKQWGDLGPVYGKQWRRWETADGRTIDQLGEAIAQIRKNPTSRRNVVSAWNVGDVHSHKKSAPPLCHTLYQFYVHVDGRLSCQLYQRSADVFLGVPFNIASYALLTQLIAHVTGLKPGHFVHTFGDVHLYNNHVDQAREQLSREPKTLPTVRLTRDVSELWDVRFEDLLLEGYDPHPAIKAPIAV